MVADWAGGCAGNWRSGRGTGKKFASFAKKEGAGPGRALRRRVEGTRSYRSEAQCGASAAPEFRQAWRVDRSEAPRVIEPEGRAQAALRRKTSLNSSSRAAATRFAAWMSDSASAWASSALKVTPGFRKRPAPGSRFSAS